MLIPRSLDWEPPQGRFDAVLFTSPQAPALAGTAARTFRHLPAFAVGERTAAAAREAGFGDVRTGGRDVGALLRMAAEAGGARLLHLGGRERTEVEMPHGLSIETRSVYAADLAETFEAAALEALRAQSIDWTLLFSARTAARFAALFDRERLARGTMSLAAISAAALAAAGDGWRRTAAAHRPSESGVLAAAGLLCDKPGG